MLQGLLAPLLLAASVAAVGALPASEECETEMNKEQLQVSCVEKGLSSIPTGLPKATGILLLASNQLAKVDLASFQHLPKLSDLDLSNNSLKALEIGAPLPQLKHLLLSHNSLENLPAFTGLPSLELLALGHNQLSQLPEGGFRGLKQLSELQLQGNQLQSLPGGAFEGLPLLKDLDLSDNRLESVPPELVSKLSDLIILRLERNRLEHLPDGFFSEEPMYVYVYLLGNPWRCDCQLVYLREWIVKYKYMVYTRMIVEVDGLDEEATENEPLQVVCQTPPREKGRPVMHFKAACGSRGDEDQEVDEEGEEAGDSRTPSPTPPPLTATAPLAPRASSHSPSTATSPTAAALTTTTSTSALSSSTTHSPTTTSPAATTTLHVLSTTAPVLAFGLSTSGATAGVPIPTSKVPRPTPGPSTSHVPPTPPRRVPPTATPCAPLAPSPTASMLTTPLAPSAPPPATAAAGHPPRPTALVPSSPSHANSSPRISAPLPTRGFLVPPLVPQPSAHCLCPGLPVRVLGVAARTGSHTGRLAGSCCLLRLGLYLACLALVALSTLVLLCRLGWLCLSWYHLALQGAPGSRLARPRQQCQEASPKGWRPQLAEAPRPTPVPRIYRVCKKFQVDPSRHVTWLLVSLPGSAGRQAQMQPRLSSYSLDRGKDTLGAVRVKYATASL